MAATHCIIPTVTGITAYDTKTFQTFSDTPETPEGINPLNTPVT